MKIAATYIRVSDDRQDEYSPDSQLKLVKDYATKNGYFIPDNLIFFDDGISAKSSKKRTQFNEMIGLTKGNEKPYDAILVWKFSRFCRNQEESIVYKSLLKKKDIQVISISEPVADGPFGDLIERIIEWMDEYYLIRLSGEVRRGMTEKASRGEPLCNAPFGYLIKDKQYFINPAEASVVNDIFESYVAGENIKKIATRLGLSGVKTPRGNKPDNRFVDYILNNPVYCGKIRWNSEGKAASKRDYHNEHNIIVDGKHEPIVSKELFELAQKRIADTKAKYPKYQRRNQPIQFMLKGLLRCSSCGSTLVHTSAKEPAVQCHSYNRGSCIVSHHLTLRKANQAVINALSECITKKSFRIAPPDKSTSKQINYDKLIAATESKLKRCKDAYINGVDTIEEYQANKEMIMREISMLHDEKNKANATESIIDPTAYAQKASNVLNLITSPDISESAKNEALRTILTKITYDKGAENLTLFFHI